MCLLTPDSACAKIPINQDLTCCQKQLLLFEFLLHLYSNFFSFLSLWEEHLAHAPAWTLGKLKSVLFRTLITRVKLIVVVQNLVKYLWVELKYGSLLVSKFFLHHHWHGLLPHIPFPARAIKATATQNLVRKILFTFYLIDLLKCVNIEINIYLFFLDSSSQDFMHLGLHFYSLHIYIPRPTICTLIVTSH